MAVRLRLVPMVPVALLLICLAAGCGDPAPPVITSTPVPTVQPTTVATATKLPPTATPVPAWSPAEQAYIGKVGDWSSRYTDNILKLGDLLANPNPFDAAWNTELNNALVDLEDLNNEVLNYQAPGRFTALHARLREAATHFDKGSNLVAEGIEQFDLAKIEQGAAEIELGAALVPQVVAELEQLTP